MEETEASREVVSEAKTTSDLLARLQESLARAADKNDSLLEAIETTEARATREGQGGSEVRRILYSTAATIYYRGGCTIDSKPYT